MEWGRGKGGDYLSVCGKIGGVSRGDRWMLLRGFESKNVFADSAKRR